MLCKRTNVALPSDKNQWFTDWHLHEHASYDLKLYLPVFVKAENIRIEITSLETYVIYNADMAAFTYFNPGKYIQGLIRVHVLAGYFKLDHFFVVYNDYPSSPYILLSSISTLIFSLAWAWMGSLSWNGLFSHGRGRKNKSKNNSKSTDNQISINGTPVQSETFTDQELVFPFRVVLKIRDGD